MGRPVVHWELMSKEPENVSAFYEKIFGLKIKHMPEMNYRIVETGGSGGINGGILKPERKEPWPGNMTLYIHVDDLPLIASVLSRRVERSMSKNKRYRAWAPSRFSP